MKPRKENETDEHYIKRLEDANASLRQDNKRLSDWAAKTSDAVTALSCDGSLVFQAMAERAGVRGHPSVTEAVKLFDAIAHPQWQREPIPKFEWPTDWDFDERDSQQSGDADMQLNAPIAALFEFLEHVSHKLPEKYWEPLHDRLVAAQAALHEGVQGIKAANGFAPKSLAIPGAEHYNKLTQKQLCEVVSGMGWAALDLAQDMHFANHALRRDLRAAVYRRVTAELYKLSDIPFLGAPEKIDIKLLGAESPF